VFAALLAAAVLVAMALRQPAKRAPDVAPPPSVAPDSVPTAQAMIGEDTHDGQLAFVVDTFSCGPKQMQAPSGTRVAQGKFCELHLTVRNTSNSPAVFLERFQYLLDGQSRTFGPDDGLSQAAAENGNRSLSELNVNPGIAVPIVLVYDVPDTVDPVEVRLRGTGRSRFGASVRLQRRDG
jgi:hypothetical protein